MLLSVRITLPDQRFFAHLGYVEVGTHGGFEAPIWINMPKAS